MLEEDYLSLKKHSANKSHTIGSQVVREIILPQLEKEVNEGKNFAQLRQVFRRYDFGRLVQARFKGVITFPNLC